MWHLNFKAISEKLPGEKWQQGFHMHWPAYKSWYSQNSRPESVSLETARKKLQTFMPEWVATYERMCALADHDPVAARFLTGYQPPAYISGCSQAVCTTEPQLVRNYDYHPHLIEGKLLHTSWNKKAVMAVSDCLWGVVDGMNEDGLVASLTFGGRKVVGEGFGIPFILRYVLEFCSTISQAVEVLQRIPTHMAYNVMVLDQHGAHKTVQMAPDRAPVVSDAKMAANHQEVIDWPEYVRFSQSLKRERYMRKLTLKPGQTSDRLAAAFGKAPLFNTRYRESFGTIYTAVYHPARGAMELRWPEAVLSQSFGEFREEEITLAFPEAPIRDGLTPQDNAIEEDGSPPSQGSLGMAGTAPTYRVRPELLF